MLTDFGEWGRGKMFQKALLAIAVAATAGVAAAPDALAIPAPVCEVDTPAPKAMVTVTPETSRQSAALTAGLIADRISTVVGGFGTIATPTLTASGFDPCNPGLGLLGEPGDQLARVPDESTAQEIQAAINGAWLGGSFTRVKKTDVGGEYSGGIGNGVVGYDRVVLPGLVAGLAAGVETVDIDTHYNAGSVESTSYTLAPYLGYALTDWLTIDGSVGHTWIDYDFTRNTSVSGSTDASRWFGATGLTATQRFDQTTLRAALGYLRLYEDQNGYVESDQTEVLGSSVNFGQARFTVGGSHQFITGFGAISPNGFIRYEYDVPHASSVSLGNGLVSSNDRSGFVAGLGVDVLAGEAITMSVSGTTAFGRENTAADSVSANVRYAF